MPTKTKPAKARKTPAVRTRPAASQPEAPKKKRPPAEAKPRAKETKPRPEAAGALAAGAKAPSFSLDSDSGERVSLGDFAGRWLVLYFYPRDNTPGCTREALAFRDAAKVFAKKGAAVVGVSRDSIPSHCKFRDAQGLNFPLLSDPDAKVHAAYGAYGDKVMYGKKVTGALRTTVLVAPNGTVARVFPNVRVDGHADAVLGALDELAG